VTPGQLSVAEAEKVTLLAQLPPAVATVISAGHVIVGFSVSLTVTVKVQPLVLPTASVALQVTGVTPLPNELPLTGSQTMLAPGQLSVTETEKVTLLAQLPPAVLTTIFAGQVACGASVSLTVMLKVQPLVFPLASVAVQVTGVVPLTKALPLGGTQA
jgi:hypothetical protein